MDLRTCGPILIRYIKWTDVVGKQIDGLEMDIIAMGYYLYGPVRVSACRCRTFVVTTR